MPFTISPKKALKIQAEQIAFYADTYPQFSTVKNNLDGLEMDKEYESRILMTRIPRGLDLGWHFGIDL